MIKSFNASFSCVKKVWTKLPGHGSAYTISVNGYGGVSSTSVHVLSDLQKRRSSNNVTTDSKQTVLVKNLSSYNGHYITKSVCAKILPTSFILQRFEAQVTNTYQKRLFHEDRKTTALTVLGSLKELKASPVPALVLGFSGLIPFVAAPTYLVMNQLFMPDIAFAQLVYGATILSFLGGIRWGMTIPEDSILQPNWFNLCYSVTPSLVAWAGVLMPSPLSSLTLMLGFAGACYMDMVSYGYPPWFKGLRFTLTFVAILSLWTTLMCSLLLDTKPNKEEKK
ncbi:transmembrane protein 69-like isoform X2 [Mizuhopecten yessoensis]|uniref:Transmembrane protein 69 n=2 Tax=Mizuhopecten yessoensis TaxID=6573 RepID=A0A210PNQ5_MIZYE|nr:transmembrane protein 69-like isoform X2 [Mizuhopecten yessoensis]OWF38084.1 Transmembrane protein 69 [Mizuhopecten yessoensis]